MPWFISFLYQRARAVERVEPRWVAGLFERLDAQRGRILMSSFLELKPTTVWIPENIAEGIAALLGGGPPARISRRA